MKIGSTLIYRSVAQVCHGFTATGLVRIYDGVTHRAVRRERVTAGRRKRRRVVGSRRFWRGI